MEQDAPMFFNTPYPDLNVILEQVYRHRGSDGQGSLRQLSEAVDKVAEKWAAASAQADSVTAPAGAEIERLRAQVESLTRDCGRQAGKIAELIADLKFQDGKHREDRAQLQTIYEHQRGECWYWQGDGQDHLESLCNTLPVVIRADQLRALVSTQPTQAQAGAAPLPKFLALKFHARRDKKATVTLLFPGHEAADAWVRGIKGGQHGL